MATKTDPVYRRTGVIEHREGCPARQGRQETFEARRPSTGELVRVDRCVDCGEQTAKVIDAGPKMLTDEERTATAGRTPA